MEPPVFSIYYIKLLKEVRRIKLPSVPAALGNFLDFAIESFNIVCFFTSGIVLQSLRIQDTNSIVVENIDKDANL
jgi:hypothetical protein